MSTGATAWNPDAGGKVLALAIHGATVYVGGEFTTMSGQTRNRLAAFDITSGTLRSWDPNANGGVRTIVGSGSILYVGGWFSTISGQTRSYIAALDTSTGFPSGWNPNANYDVLDIKISGSTVFVAGWFSSIGGQTRNGIAEIAATGSATSWNANIDSWNNDVYSFDIRGSTLFMGGTFTSIGGQPRNRLASVDVNTGSPTGWNPNSDGTVRKLRILGDTVFVAGEFTNIGGYSRNYTSSIDAVTGIPTGWSLSAGPISWPNYGHVYDLVVTRPFILAVGNFTEMGGKFQDYFAQFGEIPNPVPTISSASPTSGNRLQTGLSVTINGTEFVSGKTSVSFGSGVTINSVTVNSSTQLIANITIGPTATTGNHDITVTNSPPGGGTATLFNGFTVNNPSPTLTSISPTSANRLQTLDVGFTGTNFISGVTSVNVGTGITINSTTVFTSTSLTANITISSTASTGSRNFSVTNSTPGGGTSTTQTFNINNPLPTLTSISPTTGAKGKTFDITFAGANFISGVSSVNVGSGITVNSVTVNNSASLTANITVSSVADTGARSFFVTNASPGGGTSVQNIFVVKNQLELNKRTVSFGNVRTGQYRDTTVTVTNYGNDTLKISSITSSHSAFTARPTVKNVAPGQLLVDTLRFAPTTIGNASGLLLITSNALSSPDTINVSGNAIGVATVQLSSKSLNVDRVRIGQFKDTIVTITNTGNDTLKISNITSSNAVFTVRTTVQILPPGIAFTDTLHFAPIALGTVAATLLVASNSPSSPDTIKVSGFGFGISTMQLNTKAISIGNVKVGTFKDTTVTITNTGNDTLKITNIASSRSTFTARPTVKNIPPGQSLTDTLRFTPTTLGIDSGMILVTSNAFSSPDTINVSGFAIGVPAVQLSSKSLNVDRVRIGQFKDTIVTITNTGNDTLKISNITSSNAVFTVRTTVQILPPGIAFTDTLHFAPIALGTVAATLLVASNSPSSPDTIKVSGFGFGISTMQLNTKAISIGNVKVGTFKDTTVTITNTGNDTLKITNIASSRSTFTARPTVKNIPPGQSLADTLRFAPTVVGADSALVVIQSNSGSSPDTVKVLGVAIPTTGVEDLEEIPITFALNQNYPNPFNPSTTLRYALPVNSAVRLTIFNTLGQQVAELVNQQQNAGWHRVKWDANVSTGLYFYRIEAVSTNDPNNRFLQVKKMLLLR